MTEQLRTTPLHEEHLRLGGKMVEFAGFSLPVHYSAGIWAEHRAVRAAAGVFDVSHMGEFEISGPQALEFVQYLTVNDSASLAIGRAQYSLLSREDGGIIDDLLVYRLDQSTFLMVVNAATREKDFGWIRSHQIEFNASLEDHSERYALVALQGPRAAPILSRMTEVDLKGIGSFHFVRTRVSGIDIILARTGYTGEDGFELYLEADRVREVWVDLLDAGSALGLQPAGLGARDILRLEMGYPLYGADLDEDRTALEAGLGWVVKLEKGPFLGRSALAQQRKTGVSRKLVGIRMSEKGFPRAGYSVIVGDEVVGAVVSGTMSPSLGSGIAMAYLPIGLTEVGTSVSIRIRGRDCHGNVVRVPFYRKGSRKK